MKARAAAAFFCAFCAFCAAAARGESGAVFTAVAIVDTGGFAPGVVAFSARAPAGWHSRGGLRWTANPECVSMPVTVAFESVRSDGLAGFEVLPGAMRAWSSEPAANALYERAASEGAMGCLAPARSFGVQGYIDELFMGVHRKGRGDLRILGARRLPAIADRIEARLAGEIGAAAFDRLRIMGGGADVYGDAGIFDIGYTVRGRAIRERVFVSIGVTEIALPNPAGGTVSQTASFVDQAVSWYAPEEEFDELAPLFDFMLVSAAWNRAWTDAVARSIGAMREYEGGGPAILHRLNAGAEGFLSERREGAEAGGAAEIERGLRAPIAWAGYRRDLADPRTGRIFEIPGGAAGAFYAGAENRVLMAAEDADVDPAAWTRLTPAE